MSVKLPTVTVIWLLMTAGRSPEQLMRARSHHRLLELPVRRLVPCNTTGGRHQEGPVPEQPSISLPVSLEAEEGAAVTLSCRFDRPRKQPQRVNFQWDLPESDIYRLVPGGATVGNDSGRMTLDADLPSRSATLRISDARASDAGRYVCVIELLEPLPIIRMIGGGTQLHIVPGQAKDGGRNEPKALTDLSGNATHHGRNESKAIVDLSGNVTHQGSNEPKVIPDLSGNETLPGTIEPKAIIVLHGNEAHPGTNESKVITILHVSNVPAPEGPAVELSCLVSLLYVVGLALSAGLAVTIWIGPSAGRGMCESLRERHCHLTLCTVQCGQGTTIHDPLLGLLVGRRG
ncbi:uncharacterized protein LOC119958318 [Scyliorhinus canicula]|uniref:uncharacterized protein LOC119958318 n=1 Tax=Scyliorhinus canicula TaxID=7830 RepID=UPI0018F79EE3|nr:uncharacterized protein LOC119958318 [Scyliorhinus canicula]